MKTQPVLYIDRRNTVNGKKSKIYFDNPVALHTFVSNWVKTLPEFANSATAQAGGLKVGDLYNNTTSNTVSYVA